MPRKATARVHAVFGSDEAEVKRAAAELASRLTPPDGGDFGSEIIDGIADNADAAVRAVHGTIEALLTLPFFGSKLVWLKNATFFADSVTGRAAATVAAVEKLTDLLAKNLPDSVTLLISGSGIDKRRTFYKTLNKIAEVQTHDAIDTSKTGWEEAALAAVEQRSRARGIRLEADAAQLLALLTGGDTRQVENELEKLALYKGNAPIDTATVRTLVPLSRAGVIFELGNAVAARDLPLALALARQLLEQGESAVGILLVALVPTVRNLLLSRDLIERHRMPRPGTHFLFMNALKRLPESALDHLPRKKDGTVNTYPLALAAVHAHRFTAAELRRLLETCLEANIQLVSSSLDAETILSRTLAGLAKAPRAA